MTAVGLAGARKNPAERRRGIGLALAVALSVLAHILLVPLALRWVRPDVAPPSAPVRITVIDGDLLPEAPLPAAAAATASPAASAQPAAVRLRQLVEAARPAQEETPDDAAYLAEFDHRVERETRTDKITVNPEVVAPRPSDSSSAATASAPDVTTPPDPANSPSAADPEPTPELEGFPRSQLTPRWRPSTRDAVRGPLEVGDGAGSFAAGAPQNDHLDEAVGDSVELNTLAYPGAKYLNHLRRQINFFWSQQLDNLPRGFAFAHPRYVTHVSVVLDASGALLDFEFTRPSDDRRVDDCIRKAFVAGAPFGAPPADMLDPDGRLRLPDFGFTLEILPDASR